MNLELMRAIDEEYTDKPFYGVPRMTWRLRSLGYAVNRKRVARLMRLMGVQAICPRRKTSPGRKDGSNWKHPYLLRNLAIARLDQVWATDITYIRMKNGFVYLVAVMDWYSRYVLSWRVSNTLDAPFCVETLREAIAARGAPEIFNTDQGAQFTSEEFQDVLKRHAVRISMDGRGRALDNVMVERLWRSVKQEEVYLKEYETVRDAVSGLRSYFRFYNEERGHQSFGYRTPSKVYFGEPAAADAGPLATE